MTTEIVAKFSVAGCHCWHGAPDTVGYLQSSHRHLFVYSVSVRVQHADRHVEFHTLQGECLRWVRFRYPSIASAAEGYDFGERSCEMLAQELIEHLRSEYDVACVEVWEDGENGARVICV